MNWFDRDLFRTFTGLSSLSDAVVDVLGNGVEAAVNKFVGYTLIRGTYTQYFAGDGSRWLSLPNQPLVSVTSVHVDRAGWSGQGTDDPFDSDSLLTAGEDYFLDTGASGGYTGRLYRINDVWPVMHDRHVTRLANHLTPFPGCVKIVYVAGHLEGAPHDIQLAAIGEAVAAYKMHRTGGLMQTSESLEGHSVGFSQALPKVIDGESAPFLTPALKAACRPYRRVPIA